MSQFNVGDKVYRNSIPDSCNDADQVTPDDTGIIIAYHPDIYPTQPYLVQFEDKGQWWIGAMFITATEVVHKEQQIINKIKYLNDKFNNRKPRIVSDTVGTGVSEQLRESLGSAVHEGVITRFTGAYLGARTPEQIRAMAQAITALHNASVSSAGGARRSTNFITGSQSI